MEQVIKLKKLVVFVLLAVVLVGMTPSVSARAEETGTGQTYMTLEQIMEYFNKSHCCVLADLWALPTQPLRMVMR